jgi:hypothetical protein
MWRTLVFAVCCLLAKKPSGKKLAEFEKWQQNWQQLHFLDG